MKLSVRVMFSTAILVVALAFLLPSCSKKTTQSPLVTTLDSSIRKVRWDSLLAHDDFHFVLDSEADKELGACYRVVNHRDEGGFYGNEYYPTKYVDLNQDGKEDAIVSLSNPGSGAYASAVIFLQTLNGPKYVGCASGSHYIDSLIGDTLDIITAHWLRDEPQCCNGADDHQRIIGAGDTVRFLPLTVEPEKGRAWEAVDRFYELLESSQPAFHNYMVEELERESKQLKKEAYSLLSNDYHTLHPYKKWMKEISSLSLLSDTVYRNSPDTAVRVKITGIDYSQKGAGISAFEVVWHMKFITNNLPDGDPKDTTDWFLDRADIHEVKQETK